MVSSVPPLFNRDMVFRLKNGSSKQLLLIPESCTQDSGTYMLKPLSYNEKCAYLF